MNNLLIFFAIPIAVIIISAILQKQWESPISVAAFIFAIFLVVTFAVFDATFLIATLAYTVLSFLTAVAVKILCEIGNNEEISNCNELNNTLSNANLNNSNSCNCTRNRYGRF